MYKYLIEIKYIYDNNIGRVSGLMTLMYMLSQYFPYGCCGVQFLSNNSSINQLSAWLGHLHDSYTVIPYFYPTMMPCLPTRPWRCVKEQEAFPLEVIHFLFFQQDFNGFSFFFMKSTIHRGLFRGQGFFDPRVLQDDLSLGSNTWMCAVSWRSVAVGPGPLQRNGSMDVFFLTKARWHTYTLGIYRIYDDICV